MCFHGKYFQVFFLNTPATFIQFFRIHVNPSMGVTSGEPTKPMEGNLSTVRISELQLKSSPLHPLKVMQSAWAVFRD